MIVIVSWMSFWIDYKAVSLMYQYLHAQFTCANTIECTCHISCHSVVWMISSLFIMWFFYFISMLLNSILCSFYQMYFYPISMHNSFKMHHLFHYYIKDHSFKTKKYQNQTYSFLAYTKHHLHYNFIHVSIWRYRWWQKRAVAEKVKILLLFASSYYSSATLRNKKRFM